MNCVKYINNYDEFFKTNHLGLMNYYLSIYQFSEDILIKTLDYYDSPKCLGRQLNLSPYFCFYHLYNKQSDSSDYFTSYDDIIEYYNKSTYSYDMLKTIFLKTVNDKKSNIYNPFNL